MPKSSKSEPSLTFESALAELEGLVARMETGQLTLEQSLDAYTRGAELVQFCQGSLSTAEQRVQVLQNGVLKPFLATPDQSGAQSGD